MLFGVIIIADYNRLKLNPDAAKNIGIVFFADSEQERKNAENWIAGTGWINCLIVNREENPELLSLSYTDNSNADMFVILDRYTNFQKPQRGTRFVLSVNLQYTAITNLAATLCSLNLLAPDIISIPHLFTNKTCEDILNL